MTATIWDFYSNVLVIYLWIVYKEKSWFSKVIWLVLLVCLGSIATMLYLIIQLFKLKQNEGIEALLIKQSP